MIRRMKADILKNLPPKIREKAYGEFKKEYMIYLSPNRTTLSHPLLCPPLDTVNIEDQDLRNEFRTYMQLLRQGRGERVLP